MSWPTSAWRMASASSPLSTFLVPAREATRLRPRRAGLGALHRSGTHRDAMISLRPQRLRTVGVGSRATPGIGRCDSAGPVPVSADWLRLARLARALSWITLAWMGIEGGVAIGAAVLAGSVALLGFGLDSGIEALASIIVIWRFTGTRLASATSERRAQQLVAVSFFLLAPYIAVRGVRAVAAGDRAETSVAGLQLGYHNHAIDLKKLEGGVMGLDTLIQGTDPNLVVFEMDCGHVIHAG